jgi:hypothetical protein
MSQHRFRIGGGREMLVGWDPHLGTFFAQVYPVDERGDRIEFKENSVGDEDEDATLLWVGTTLNEIRTVDQLKIRMAPYKLPAPLEELLFREEVN